MRTPAFAVAACAAIVAQASAQEEPAVEPALVEPALVEPAPTEPAPTDPVPPQPPVAQQAAPPPSVLDARGVELGARIGYALPFGYIVRDGKLGAAITGVAALSVEAGYRLNADFAVGALFQYGIMQTKHDDSSGCGAGATCSGHIMRLGVQAIFNLPFDTALRPWVGIGTGYEWFYMKESIGGGRTLGGGLHGFELVNLQAGGDYRLAPTLTLGPFISVSFARYVTTPPAENMGVDNTRTHEWLQLGVRGRFGL